MFLCVSMLYLCCCLWFRVCVFFWIPMLVYGVSLFFFMFMCHFMHGFMHWGQLRRCWRCCWWWCCAEEAIGLLRFMSEMRRTYYVLTWDCNKQRICACNHSVESAWPYIEANELRTNYLRMTDDGCWCVLSVLHVCFCCLVEHTFIHWGELMEAKELRTTNWGQRFEEDG